MGNLLPEPIVICHQICSVKLILDLKGVYGEEKATIFELSLGSHWKIKYHISSYPVQSTSWMLMS